MQDATISVAITPFLPGMKSLSVGCGSQVQGVAECEAWAEPRRDALDASSRLTSFSVEERGNRALPQSSWHVHRWSGQSVFVVDTSTVDSGLNNISTVRWAAMSLLLGWGLGAYVRDKNTSARVFVLKRRGGLMREGGRICGTLRYLYPLPSFLGHAQLYHYSSILPAGGWGLETELLCSSPGDVRFYVAYQTAQVS